MRGFIHLVAVFVAVASAPVCWSEPPPIDAFASMPAISAVTLSPDGSQVAYVAALGDVNAAIVFDRANPAARHPILKSDPGKYDINRCDWANDKRLLCSLRVVMSWGGVQYPASRLIAVNADGSGMRLLFSGAVADKKDTQCFDSSACGVYLTQYQDRVIDWTPDDPDHVLIELDVHHNGMPSVYSLDVNNGVTKLHTLGHDAIRTFGTDGRGNVRLAYGFKDTRYEYFARPANEQDWQKLARVEAFTSGDDSLKPISVAPGSNRALAVGNYQGRLALWEIDLADKNDPTVVFSHPLVDIDTDPLLAADHRLLGVRYDLDRPFVFYTDDAARERMVDINSAFPNTFNFISDASKDEKVLIVTSYSDVASRSYAMFDTGTRQLQRLGNQYPQLKPEQLGKMSGIRFKASDGTEVQGYLTLPPGVRAEQLPLIVLPHGGPIHRDYWGFDFLVQFLATRGYAVLQVNFRGSSGYGADWYYAAHQDWGGLTYSDIADATRWVIKEGIANPKRVAIAGWSFGGYAAQLGAVRNSDLFRCAISIAGVSDLPLLLREKRGFDSYQVVRRQLGFDMDKLREDSPLRHIDGIKIPMLLVHGTRDFQVDVDHSRKLDAALKVAHKPHRTVFIDDASHQMDRRSDRMVLLSEIEQFLRENLGAGQLAQN